MQDTTNEHRQSELQTLLANIEARPTHDWTEERKRILVLRQLIDGAATSA